METITIDFHIPTSWSELSNKQVRYVYQLIAQDFATDEVKTLCLLRWSGTKVMLTKTTARFYSKRGTIVQVERRVERMTRRYRNDKDMSVPSTTRCANKSPCLMLLILVRSIARRLVFL